jgi:hypothetical protein
MNRWAILGRPFATVGCSSLEIRFDEYVKDQEFRGLDRLTLNNCVQDPTKAQQFMAYSLMGKAGVPVPRSNLARVVVNGEDLGIYANVESIRKAFIKHHFGDAKGDLFESVANAGQTTNMMHRIVHGWGKQEGPAAIAKLVDVLGKPGLAPAWSPVRRRTPQRTVDTNAPMQIEGSFSAVIAEAFPGTPASCVWFSANRADNFGRGTAALRLTVDGWIRQPFTQFGAMAVAKHGVARATIIRVSASDPAGDFLWHLSFRIDPHCMTAGTARRLEEWIVGATVIQGDPYSPKAQTKSNTLIASRT